jgi:hypothetical protein
MRVAPLYRPGGLCHAARFANEREIRASMPLFPSPDILSGVTRCVRSHNTSHCFSKLEHINSQPPFVKLLASLRFFRCASG